MAKKAKVNSPKQVQFPNNDCSFPVKTSAKQYYAIIREAGENQTS
jgi:hypothetical protein